MALGGKPFTLTLGNQQNRLAQNLPFLAQAVQCDNFTNQWLWIAEVGVFVPPYYTDRVLLLPEVSTLTVVPTPPVGYIQAPVIVGQQAVFTPFADQVQPSNGVYQPPSAGLAATTQYLVHITSSVASPAAQQTINIPPNLQGVGLYWITSSGASGGFTVVSLPSGLQLTPILVSGGGGSPANPAYYLIPPENLVPADTQLQFNVTGGGAINPTSTLYAWLIPAANIVYTDPNLPLAVQGFTPQPGAPAAVPVPMREPPPDWEGHSISTSGTVAANFTVTPPAGKRVLVRNVEADQAAPGAAAAAINQWSVSGPTSGVLIQGHTATTATAGDADHGFGEWGLFAVNEVVTFGYSGPGTAWTALRASGWYV